MANDVKVVIKLQKVVRKLGFGMPLFITGKAEQPKAYTEYRGIDEVEKDYPLTTPMYKAAELFFLQENAPEKIAMTSVTTTVLESLKTLLLNKDWRQLVVVGLGEEGGESTLAEIADYLEVRRDKLFCADVSTLTDIVALADRKYKRTLAFYYDQNKEEYPCPVAALLGETAGKAVGSITYKNQILSKLPPLELTEEKLQEIHAAGAMTLVTKAGDNVTSEGKTLGGEYIDIVDTEDWLIQQIEYKVQKAFNMYDKIPYDDNGVNVLDSVVITVLKEAYTNGMIAMSDEGLPAYWTDFAKRIETDPSDRSERKYIGGEFGFELAGAIHEATITGVIMV